jgi:hypothetical protein
MESTYLIAKIRGALAREAGELAVDIVVKADLVYLCGVVSSEEQRQRIEAAARPFCTAHELVNEIQILPPRAPEAPEALH